MTEILIYKTILEYFAIEELVGPRVAHRYGNRALRFFDLRLLETIIFIRTKRDKPIHANNYKWGGNLSQRGLRENTCQIVKDKTLENKMYLSAHVLGKGIDFNIEGETAEQTRQWLKEKADDLPFKIRLEAGVNWVHLDTIWEDKNPKVYIFNP